MGVFVSRSWGYDLKDVMTAASHAHALISGILEEMHLRCSLL